MNGFQTKQLERCLEASMRNARLFNDYEKKFLTNMLNKGEDFEMTGPQSTLLNDLHKKAQF